GAARRRHVPRRGEGGRDRRGRRGRARARSPGRAGRERRRRRRARRGAARAASRDGARSVSSRRYGEPLPLGEPGGMPYSKGLMARARAAAGVSIERAYELATRIEVALAERDARSTALDRVEELACEVLGFEEGSDVVRRLRRYAALHSLDLPILLFVGGATGTGKSTVATEAAHRLGITRVTSTDFIRQTMRAFFSEAFMPSVHYSSFEAGQSVVDSETADPTISGFLEQTRNVLVGV